MNVFELARSAGVTPSAVRMYARAGVLPGPRPQSDGRLGYSDADASLLRLAVGLHRLGLGELRDLAAGGPSEAERTEAMKAQIARRRRAIERRRNQLEAIDGYLAVVEAALGAKGASGPASLE